MSAHFHGGKVAPSSTQEYGRANLTVIKDAEALFLKTLQREFSGLDVAQQIRLGLKMQAT
jgi:GMP synthase-like glutamine amidotransferase